MDQLDAFLEMSVPLTGFEKTTLQGTGVGETYLETLEGVVGKTVVGDLLNAWSSVKAASGGNPAKLKEGIRTYMLGDAKLGPVTRNVIKMWYMGNWYALSTAWMAEYNPKYKGNGNTYRVVSTQAYINGLAWQAMRNHAKGANWPGWRSWESAPNDLEGVF